MNKKISIIVPVYNNEKYLEKCLISLLNQTYKNIEIIIIEDNSTDKSREILKNYSSNKNIKIINNSKNMGAAYSRNIGLEAASGEYIGFIDSDDYVETDYYEKLMQSIIKNKSEIAICDIKIIYENTKSEIISKCCDFEEFSVLNVINNGLVASPCNKLFKKEIIKKYPFAEGKINEDIAVIIPALINSKKISYANTYYYYVQHKGSVQNSNFSFKKFDIFDGVDTALERIKKCEHYEKFKDAIIFNQIITLFLYVIPKEKNLVKRRKYIKIYCKLSKKYNIKMNHNYWNFYERCGTKHKIYYKLLFKALSYNLYDIVNGLIFFYDIISKFKRKKIIKEGICKDDIIGAAKKQQKLSPEEIKISVIVPNYNYERFLEQRIYSILNQNYKIHELIILDDKSNDNSIKKIEEIKADIKNFINIKTIYNEKNSGSAFKQWKKGIESATGDYVWIAEADDYCDNKLISTLAKPLKKRKNVMISYCDTAFIDIDGNIILKSIKPEIDIQKCGHWNKSYINNGMEEIKNYIFLNCTIANVSSCLIKNGNYNEYLTQSGEYKQAGDWLFYVNLISMGDIAYTNKTLNYYRVHGNNVSSTMNYQKHIDEINKIHSYFIERFKLNNIHKKKIKERIDFLKKVWKIKE